MGQIYIPVLNWFLLTACVVLVCSVPSISEIGNAYGKFFYSLVSQIAIIVVSGLSPAYGCHF